MFGEKEGSMSIFDNLCSQCKFRMSFLFGNRSSKTFKPKKNIPEGSHQHELMKHAAATLGSGMGRENKQSSLR